MKLYRNKNFTVWKKINKYGVQAVRIFQENVENILQE